MVRVAALLPHLVLVRRCVLLLLERNLLRDHCLLFSSVSIDILGPTGCRDKPILQHRDGGLLELAGFVENGPALPRAGPPVVVPPGSIGSC